MTVLCAFLLLICSQIIIKNACTGPLTNQGGWSIRPSQYLNLTFYLVRLALKVLTISQSFKRVERFGLVNRVLLAFRFTRFPILIVHIF